MTAALGMESDEDDEGGGSDGDEEVEEGFGDEDFGDAADGSDEGEEDDAEEGEFDYDDLGDDDGDDSQADAEACNAMHFGPPDRSIRRRRLRCCQNRRCPCGAGLRRSGDGAAAQGRLP
jgi:hypothetical protein